MNFFQRLRFMIFGTPYVLTYINGYSTYIKVRPVHFIMGKPYTTIYGDRTRLMPRGATIGYKGVQLWEPATPDMNYYFNPPNE